MVIVMAGLVCLYLDLIVVSKDIKEHVVKLIKKMKRLSVAGLTINPKKCVFFHRRIEYLGYTILSKFSPLA